MKCSLIQNLWTETFKRFYKPLTTFDKKLSKLETIVNKMAEANYNYATSQQTLNKQQASLNKDLGEGIKMLGNNMSDIIKFLQKQGGNN